VAVVAVAEAPTRAAVMSSSPAQLGTAVLPLEMLWGTSPPSNCVALHRTLEPECVHCKIAICVTSLSIRMPVPLCI
jgi:hypothetical protein